MQQTNQDYSVPGTFGEVRLYSICNLKSDMDSVSTVSGIGWHRVNRLYRIKRAAGIGCCLMLLTTDGDGDVEIGGRRFRVAKNTVTFLPAGIPHSYGTGSGGMWEFYWVHYSGACARLITSDLVKNKKPVFACTEREQKELVDRLRACHADTADNLRNISYIIDDFLRGMLFASSASGGDTETGRVVSGIMTDLSSDPLRFGSLRELCKKYCYSEGHLIRIFRKHTGMTPYSYRRNILLRQAAERLLDTSRTVGEIARELGYSGVGSFSNQFSERYGISPTEYRRTLTGKGNFTEINTDFTDNGSASLNT